MTATTSAYDGKAVMAYEGSDMHIGFRVHGHLWTLSQRRPSFLLNEDARGRAAQEALGLQSFDAVTERPIGVVFDRWTARVPRLPHDPRRRLRSVLPDPAVVEPFMSYVDVECRQGFPRATIAFDVIDRTYPRMRAFIENLP